MNDKLGPTTETRLLNLEEVSYRLRLSRHTIRAMCRDHRLEPVRICRRLLFNPADIESLIARCSGQQSEPLERP